MISMVFEWKWLRPAAASLILALTVGQLVGCTDGSARGTDDVTGSTGSAGDRTSVASTAPATSNPATTQTTTRATTDPATIRTTAPPPVVTAVAGPPGRTGVFSPAPGSSAVAGTGPLRTYSVETEESLGLDPAAVAATVDSILSDPRSWIADGSVGMQRVETGAGIRIIVASPATVDQRCLPLNTAGHLSCHSGNSVNINSDRWFGATSDWTLGIDAYRGYVVNHEVGHALGHDHEYCGGEGQLAPVMMQQTKGLLGCIGNSWPFPGP